MQVNNYNQSSTGTDLELICGLDTDISQMYFQESFIRLDNHYYFYSDLRTVPDCPSDCYDFSKCTEKDFRVFVWENYTGTMRQLIEERNMISDDWKEFAIERMDDETLKYYMQEDFPEINNAVLNYTVVGIKGYSQGDYASILCHNNDIFDGITTYFSNLFFDAPIYCRITVDEEDFYLDEGLTDPYTWNQEEIIDYAKKQKLSGAVIKWLQANLPDYPDYD